MRRTKKEGGAQVAVICLLQKLFTIFAPSYLHDGVRWAEMRWQPPDPPKNKPGYPEDLIREEEEDETRGIMKLAEANLAELLNSEPDIYTLKDLRIDYKNMAASVRGGDAPILER